MVSSKTSSCGYNFVVFAGETCIPQEKPAVPPRPLPPRTAAGGGEGIQGARRGLRLAIRTSVASPIRFRCTGLLQRQPLLLTGTPASDWGQQARHPGWAGGNRRGWSAARPPRRFSNAGLAIALCFPMVVMGMTLGQYASQLPASLAIASVVHACTCMPVHAYPRLG